MSNDDAVENLLAELACACGDNCGCGNDCQCGDVLDLLFELLDHEIPADDEHRLLRHGAQCPNCTDRISAEIRVRRVIQRGCAGEQAPEHLRMRITQWTAKFR